MVRTTKRKRTNAYPGYTHIESSHGIDEYVLTKNGLRVLYHHDSSAPVAGLMVTYLVGSRHEAVGYTGATHLLEHLMFKGSKDFPAKDGLSGLERFSMKGALVNASTWLDRTNYYEVLPEEYFEFAVHLEADRMRHATLTEKDREEEMPAVRSEFALRVENEPLEFIDQRIWASAFMAHPYHHPTIGWQQDFEQVSIERLQKFYDTYYWPNNAVVTVVGNIERKKALALVRKYFGVHTRSPRTIPVPYTTEPPQQGRRFVEVRRPGTKDVVGVAYKTPAALHTDTPALMAFSELMVTGKTSRLYRALVEKELCLEVSSYHMPFFDPSLMVFYATPAPGVAHEKVESIIRRECKRVADSGVSVQELTKVVSQMQTDMAFARDGQYAMLSVLNEAIAAGDWKLFFALPTRIASLKKKSIQDVAQKYTKEEDMTVGYYRASHR